MIRRLRSEESGWAMVTAMLVLMICGGVGMASLSTIDAQQRESGVVRTRESAFNLAEGVLGAQIFRLSQRWPGKGADGSNPAYPPYGACTHTSTGGDCPSPEMVKAVYDESPDLAVGATWQTSVHDNASPSLNFYDDSDTLAEPGYDRNGDGRIWVRAQGSAKGRNRTLVALVRIETMQEEMPRAALLAGALDITNNGKKVIIDAQGDAATAGLVAVRCDPAVSPTLPCNGQPQSNPGHLEHQISPFTVQTGYGSANALDNEAIARLEATAIADGTWFATCPPSIPSGIVWIDGGHCNYQGNQTVNSPDKPGVLIQRTGTLALGGTVTFYGVIYHLNRQMSASTVVRLYGNTEVFGGVIVDGAGSVDAGSSKENITIDDRGFKAVRSYATAGIIQNTWREIQPED